MGDDNWVKVELEYNGSGLVEGWDKGVHWLHTPGSAGEACLHSCMLQVGSHRRVVTSSCAAMVCPLPMS
jgi:hypothetical protein